MTPTDETTTDPASPLATPEALGELRQRAEERVAAQRDARQEVEHRLADELDQLTRQFDEEFEQQRGEFERQREELEQQQGDWEQVCAQVEQDLGAREQQIAERSQELDRWAAELADERLAIEAARREAPADSSDAPNTELQEKLELVLADVEHLRSRNAELEQEIAERPEADVSESAELATLRSERDELAEQVEQLRSASSGESGGSLEVEDLRRRFELAVEDVRQLKTEKAELEEKLSRLGDVDTGDGLDWESQKRRLLAALEEDNDSLSPERREERATIEGTIRITDEVVAQKDRQIAELEEQLAAGSGEAPVPAPPVLDDDERLAAERERLAQLEQEWQEKLRTAELELSVERAKIAREQAELAEWRLELEAHSEQAAASQNAEGKSQRRWLDKLGLGGGE